MAKIETLFDNAGTATYPHTLTDAVYDKQGKKLSNTMKKMIYMGSSSSIPVADVPTMSTDDVTRLSGAITDVSDRLDDVKVKVDNKPNSHIFADRYMMELWLSNKDNTDPANGVYGKPGDTIYVKDPDVPDYWISEVLSGPDTTTGFYFTVNEGGKAETDMSKHLGTKDISKIGDGTVTGAIVDINKSLDDKVDLTTLDLYVGNIGALAQFGNGTITNAIVNINNDLTKLLNKHQVDIKELFQSVSNGKQLVANAITDKGIATSSSDTFATMADNIKKIISSTGGGTSTNPGGSVSPSTGTNTIPLGTLSGNNLKQNCIILDTKDYTNLYIGRINTDDTGVIISGIHESVDEAKTTELHLVGSSYVDTREKHVSYNISTNAFLDGTTLPYMFSYGCAVCYRNEVHILGGVYSRMSHYKWNGTEWVEVSTLPYGLYGGNAIVIDDELHIIGGYDNNSSSTSHVGSTNHYKWDGAVWTKVSTLPYKACDSGVEVINNELHLFGGSDDTLMGIGKTTNICHYKFDGENWIELSELPIKFSGGVCALFNGHIHLIGGQLAMCQHLVYNETDDTWTTLNPIPNGYISQNPAYVVYNNRLHVMGSYVETHSRTHYAYDGNTWTKLPILPHKVCGGCAVNLKLNLANVDYEVLDRYPQGSNVSHYSRDVSAYSKIKISVDNNTSTISFADVHEITLS